VDRLDGERDAHEGQGRGGLADVLEGLRPPGNGDPVAEREHTGDAEQDPRTGRHAGILAQVRLRRRFAHGREWQRETVRLKERFERLTERVPALKYLLGVQKRYSALNGNALAAQITLNGFTAMFALIVLATAVIGFISAGNGNFAHDLVGDLGLSGNAARTVTKAVAAARDSRRTATIVGLAGLVWVGVGLGGSIASAYNTAWKVKNRGLVDKAFGLLWLLGAAVLIALGAGATAAWSFLPGFFAPLVIIVSIAVNAAIFMWTSWILANRRVPLRALVRPALMGGVGLEVLKVLGGYLVPRLVQNSSQLYGTIGVVFALLAWLFILGRLIVYVVVIEVTHWEHEQGTDTAPVRRPALDGEQAKEADRSPSKVGSPAP
jgi:membrane protein